MPECKCREGDQQHTNETGDTAHEHSRCRASRVRGFLPNIQRLYSISPHTGRQKMIKGNTDYIQIYQMGQIKTDMLGAQQTPPLIRTQYHTSTTYHGSYQQHTRTHLC